MTLATRCTSCGTVFRVVQDQLKVSDGWVRCGRCKQVFNASESLIDLEQEPGAIDAPAAAASRRPGGPDSRHGALPSQPAPLTPAQPAPFSPPVQRAPLNAPPHSVPVHAGMPSAAGSRTSGAAAPAATKMRFSAPTLSRPGSAAAPWSYAPSAPDDDAPPPPDQLYQRPAPLNDEPPAPAVPFVPLSDPEHTHIELPLMPGAAARMASSITPPQPAAEAPLPFDADAPLAHAREALAPEPSQSTFARDAADPPAAVTTSMLAADAALATPAFVRESAGAARAGRSGALWVGAAALLAVLLAGQAALHARRLIVEAVPGTRPVLTGLCGLAGCTLEPLKRIDQLVVESSGLTELAQPAEKGALRLSVAVRNRGPHELATPTVDLSLTDVRGQLVSRRALGPADFDGAPRTIGPGDETMLQLVFTVGNQRVTGYTVEIFYP